MKSSIKDEIGEDISRRQVKEYKNVINIEESLPYDRNIGEDISRRQLKNTKL